MTAFPPSFTFRSYKLPLVGIALVASLGLAGCSGGNSEANSASAAPSSTLAPADTVPAPPPADSGVYERPSKNTEGVFSNEDGFSVAFGNKDKNQLLTPDGGVSRFKGSADEDIVSFTAYEKSGANNWNVTLPQIDGGSEDENLKDKTLIELLRWEGKSYVVAYQVAKVATSASGLEAGKAVTLHNTYVIDIETGKIANTVKSERPSSSSASTDVFVPVYYNKTENGKPAFATALVTSGVLNNVSSYRALNPLTGEVIDEGPGTEKAPFFAGGKLLNEFDIKDNPAFKDFNYSTLVNTFGDFALVRSGSEIEVGAYNPNANVTQSLINLKTGKIVSGMECAPVTNENVGSVDYSANFRYVAFDGNYIFDTETGKSFCGAKTGSRSGLAVYAVDNEGNIFGKNDSGKLLKVNIADNSVVELYDVAGHDVPVSFTSEGLGVFPDGETTVLLPLKK